MIRKAGVADMGILAAFLEHHIDTSMFLLGNLERHGVDNADHPHGTSYFLRETGDGITGVFGATNGGYLMCQLPGLSVPEAQTYAHLLKGYTMRGMTGAPDQVALILDGLALAEDAFQTRRDEPLFARDLAQIAAPDCTMRAPNDDDLSLLSAWFAAYAQETGLATRAQAVAQAGPRARAAIDGDYLRLLIEDDAPVAMAGINAKAGNTVQVGSVFTPPDLRLQGRAGRAVAGYLHELRTQGISRAILFAASDTAAGAYRRIGFDQMGHYTIATLKAPETLRGLP